MQEVIYIDTDPPLVEGLDSGDDDHEEDVEIVDDYATDIASRAEACAAAATQAILGEMQGKEDKDVHLVFSLLVFATTTQEPVRTPLLLQLLADTRTLKQQYMQSNTAGSFTASERIERALVLAKLTYILEYHGLLSPVRDELVELLADEDNSLSNLTERKPATIRAYRSLLLLQYLAAKLRITNSGFAKPATLEVWKARSKILYIRGSIHRSADQDAWREQTHLCCDVIILMSDFGQLRLPAKTAAAEALYICDEAQLRRAIRLHDLELTAKLCRCFRILDADCTSLCLQAMEFITKNASLWDGPSNNLELSCLCVVALKAASPRGFGPFEPLLAQFSPHPANAPRREVDLVVQSSEQMSTLTSMLEAMYSSHLLRGQLEPLPEAYTVGEIRLELLRRSRAK